MKDNVINNILMCMIDRLGMSEIQELKEVLYIQLNEYDLVEKETSIVVRDNSSEHLIGEYLYAMEVSGRSVGTLLQYKRAILSFIYSIGKPLNMITTEEVRVYLYKYKHSGVQNSTLDNVRRYLNAFFNWLRKNKRLLYNPIEAVGTIKQEIKIKDRYSKEDLILMRNACNNKRDLALIDFLDATMARVSEVVKLNQKDIDFNEKECRVSGKGNKQRKVYFSDCASIHLKNYVDSRIDNNNALFVSLNKPYARLSDNGIRQLLKRLEKQSKVEHIYPHKFRRTGATVRAENGINSVVLQHLLGHESFETTRKYIVMSENVIKVEYLRTT